MFFAILGSGWTYGPELLDDVELDIVLGDLLKDNKVVLGLVEGRESGRVSMKGLLENVVRSIGAFRNGDIREATHSASMVKVVVL